MREVKTRIRSRLTSSFGLRLYAVLMCSLALSTPQANAEAEQNKNGKRQTVRGGLCCPEKHYWVEDSTCVPYTNTSITFSPPVKEKNRTVVSADDISWALQKPQCPQGYDAKAYEFGTTARLSLDEDGLHLDYIELVMNSAEEFCVGLRPSGDYVGVFCRPNVSILCADATCVQKCCSEDEVVNYSIGQCVPNPARNFSLHFHSISGISVPAPSDLLLISQIPPCTPIVLLNPVEVPRAHFFLTQDGLLYRPAKEEVLQENRFCLDYFLLQGDAGMSLAALVCSGPPLPTKPLVRWYYYAAGSFISVIAITLTILFYNLIPKLRDMQDLNQLCHMASLLVGEITLFISYVFSNDIHRIYCVVNGIIEQFALLSAFFWLNVMCFDIHQYVRATVKCIPRAAIQNGLSARFKRYLIYAFGCPFLITLATAILHYLPDFPDTVILRPGFGVFSCWFYGDLERLTFFYIWIGALFVGNIVLLGHTAYMLYQAGVIFQNGKKSELEGGENHATNRRSAEKFWQSFSLFSIMVLCWITEILSWKIPPYYIWIPTDIINTLQGFFIFILFIRVKKRRNLVKEALRKTIFRVSETARKISRSEGSSGTVWHYDNSMTLWSNTGENISQENGVPVEEIDENRAVISSSQ